MSADPQPGRDWDAFYAARGVTTSVWSGRVNGQLPAEVADLAPGTALDVGCGEGADAVWLAQRGWQVTALDPSGVALDRARAAASAAAVDVTWVHSGFLEAARRLGTFDLVSVQYGVLAAALDAAAIAALCGAVAPGGTLLIVHHDLEGGGPHAGRDRHAAHAHDHDDDHDHEADRDHHADRACHVAPDAVRVHLDQVHPGAWHVITHERRGRPGRLGAAEVDHVRDVVLRARRTAGTTAAAG